MTTTIEFHYYLHPNCIYLEKKCQFQVYTLFGCFCCSVGGSYTVNIVGGVVRRLPSSESTKDHESGSQVGHSSPFTHILTYKITLFTAHLLTGLQEREILHAQLWVGLGSKRGKHIKFLHDICVEREITLNFHALFGRAGNHIEFSRSIW